MNAPAGYTALDLVGFTDKGVYNSATNYVQNDLTHYGGNIWRCLIDDTTNITPSEGLNWTLWIGEPTNLTEAIIAPLEVSPATDAHSVGDQLIFNDVLYKVISAISIGDSLTVGTNIEAARKIVYQISGIESDIATIEPTSTASKNYAVGEYMFFGWEFYRVTTAITAGDTIVTTGAGQNVTEVTVGDELTLLNSNLTQKANQADIATIENGSTASRNFAKGDFIYHNGALYRVIAAIQSGESFTSSNITEDKVGDELAKLQKTETLTPTVLITGNTVYASRYGNVVTVIARGTYPTVSANWDEWASGLPKPENTVDDMGLSISGGVYSVQIGTDGKLRSYPRTGATTGDTIRWVITYICKQD